MKKTKTNKKTISTYYHHLRPQNLLDYHANAIFSYQHPFVLHLHRAKLCCSFFFVKLQIAADSHTRNNRKKIEPAGMVVVLAKKNQMMKRKQGGEKLTEKSIDWFCILLMTISGIFGFCRTKNSGQKKNRLIELLNFTKQQQQQKKI